MSTENFFWWVGVVLAVMLLLKVGRRLVKAAVVVVLMLAIVLIGSKAFAADAKPWVSCGSTVTWAVQPSPGTPESAKAAIGAAYAEVAAVTGLTVMVQVDGGPGTATTVMAWDNPGSGVVYAAGSTASDVNAMTGVEARVHYFSQAGPNAGPALETLILKAITQDENVAVKATGGHLTKADKVALKASCKAKATPALSTPAPAAGSNVTAAPDGAAKADVPATATTPATRVTVTAREKVIGYGGAGAAGIVLAVTLFGGRIRNLVSKRGIKGPSWSGIKDRVKGLRRKPAGG